MKASRKTPILAAGGIVVRDAARPLIAVVRLRKEKAWVLPKGKLKPGETPRDAARREVEEETGHDVSVHEFVGAMSYGAAGRQKIVQFWHMRAGAAPARALMDDVKAVKWLPLRKAVATLSRERERTFLSNNGPAVLKAAGHSGHAAPDAAVEPATLSPGTEPQRSTFTSGMRAWFRRLTQPVVHRGG